jgi:hypothetical protein
MNNQSLLEECFKKLYKDVSHWPRESIIDVNINLLKELRLLHYHSRDEYDPTLTRYFQVIETTEKITLINEEFVVWIVPEKVKTLSSTFIIIALNKPDNPQVELAFTTTGVYNTSRLVLRVLERLLFEIQENEECLKKIMG